MKTSFKRCGSCLSFADCAKRKLVNVRSKACSEHIPLAELPCPECGSPSGFKTQTKKPRKFCSHSCRASHVKRIEWASRSSEERREAAKNTGLMRFNAAVNAAGGIDGVLTPEQAERHRAQAREKAIRMQRDPEMMAKRASGFRRRSASMKGKTLEQIYGQERAEEIRSKMADGMKGNTHGRLSKGGGRCRWYTYVDSGGQKHKVQGLYEVRVAFYLDRIGVQFIAHTGTIEHAGKTYMPDFKLKDGRFLEVKNSFRLETQAGAKEVGWHLWTEKTLAVIGTMTASSQFDRHFIRKSVISKDELEMFFAQRSATIGTHFPDSEV